MPPLQQHIEDSLENKIGKIIFQTIWKYTSPTKIRTFNKSRAIDEAFDDTAELVKEILDIIRGEVETLKCLGEEQNGLVTTYVKRQDVLDLLKTNQE